MGARVRRVGCWLIGLAMAGAAGPAFAQANLDAGKSAAQIFSDTCGACHRSPRELNPTSAGFLREHYSTGGREAAAMAAYLSSIGSDPRAVQQRRPPTLGAGQAAAPAEGGARTAHGGPNGEAAKPAATEAAKPAASKPRRPSDSVESGRLPVAALPNGSESPPSQTAAAPPPAPHPVEEFEE
jgi:hypothetical protein